MSLKRENIFGAFTLFTSLGTLICCVLPVIFVTLGAGTALAGLVSAVPQLVWFSEQKAYVFAFAALMIAAAGYLRWKNRNAPCPVDPAAARQCLRLRKIGGWLFRLSVAIYLTGFFFAFVAPYFI